MDDKRVGRFRLLMKKLIVLGICPFAIFLLYYFGNLFKEKVYSDSLKNGTNVYVDIVDINPNYSVTSRASDSRTGQTKYMDKDLVCLCHSKDGEEFYLYVDYSDYIDFYLGEYDYDDFQGVRNNGDWRPEISWKHLMHGDDRPEYLDLISYKEAVQIHGKIKNANSLADDLSEEIGTDHVVQYDYLVYEDFTTQNQSD